MTPPSKHYEVYLSYNQRDIDSVEYIATRLQEAGVRTWFFPWQVTAGDTWAEMMEAGMSSSACGAVIFGPHDLGEKQKQEVEFFSRRAGPGSNESFRIIPVLLPGANPNHLPEDIKRWVWVDFREGLHREATLNSLLAAIRGAAPDENAARKDISANTPAARPSGDRPRQHRLKDYLGSLSELLESEAGKRLAPSERTAFGPAGAMASDAASPLDSLFYLAAVLHRAVGRGEQAGLSFLNALKVHHVVTGRAADQDTLSVVKLLDLGRFQISEVPEEYDDDYPNVLPTRELASVIKLAADIATAAEGAAQAVETRHVIGAILSLWDSDFPPSAAIHLENLDYDLGALYGHFRDYINKYHPQSLHAWKKFLATKAAPGGGRPPDAPAADEAAEQESIQRASVSDQPSARDTLGFAPYVKAIATFLNNEKTQPPLTLSVEGEWGSGKSSFMLQLAEALADELRADPHRRRRAEMRRLMPGLRLKRLLRYTPLQDVPWLRRFRVRRVFEATPPPRLLTVEFNPWRHDKENALWASFALEFVRKLSQNMSPGARLRAYLKLLARRFKWMGGLLILFRMGALVLLVGALVWALVQLYWADPARLLGAAAGDDKEGAALLGVLKASGFAGYFAALLYFLSKFREFVGNPFAFDLRKYVESPDYEGNVAFIEQFHEDFKKIVETYAGGNKVYVFIDDLDRCDVPK
ncbi:MAG TPA: TIR domain-containing protein, partial [Pyrinomonadaceae bacterium]